MRRYFSLYFGAMTHIAGAHFTTLLTKKIIGEMEVLYLTADRYQYNKHEILTLLLSQCNNLIMSVIQKERQVHLFQNMKRFYFLYNSADYYLKT